jgi:superfamily I DNA/RNA helicase
MTTIIEKGNNLMKLFDNDYQNKQQRKKHTDLKCMKLYIKAVEDDEKELQRRYLEDKNRFLDKDEAIIFSVEMIKRDKRILQYYSNFFKYEMMRLKYLLVKLYRRTRGQYYILK